MENEVLLITTEEMLDDARVIRAYNVASLLDDHVDAQAIVALVQATTMARRARSQSTRQRRAELCRCQCMAASSRMDGNEIVQAVPVASNNLEGHAAPSGYRPAYG